MFTAQSKGFANTALLLCLIHNHCPCSNSHISQWKHNLVVKMKILNYFLISTHSNTFWSLKKFKKQHLMPVDPCQLHKVWHGTQMSTWLVLELQTALSRTLHWTITMLPVSPRIWNGRWPAHGQHLWSLHLGRRADAEDDQGCRNLSILFQTTQRRT